MPYSLEESMIHCARSKLLCRAGDGWNAQLNDWEAEPNLSPSVLVVEKWVQVVQTLLQAKNPFPGFAELRALSMVKGFGSLVHGFGSE